MSSNQLSGVEWDNGGYIYLYYKYVYISVDKDLCSSHLLLLLQVLILQEKLEEKDGEIERLKQEVHQMNQIDDEKADSASNKKAIDETMISEDAGNWDIHGNFVWVNQFSNLLLVVCTLKLNEKLFLNQEDEAKLILNLVNPVFFWIGINSCLKILNVTPFFLIQATSNPNNWIC